MEKINPFDDEAEHGMKNADALREVLVSEIGSIRDSLAIVNIFFGEAILSAVKFIQVFEPNNDK